MERINPHARADSYGSRINRSHVPLVATAVPWGSIMLASVLPLPILSAALPVLPPLGLMMLLGWRMVRPGLLPVWAGLPLGLFDDLFNGQPFGFATAGWSLALIAIEISETRFPWRSFWQDWALAAVLLLAYLGAGWVLSGAPITLHALVAMGPQAALAVLLFPLAARVVARLDLLRLRRWVKLG